MGKHKTSTRFLEQSLRNSFGRPLSEEEEDLVSKTLGRFGEELNEKFISAVQAEAKLLIPNQSTRTAFLSIIERFVGGVNTHVISSEEEESKDFNYKRWIEDSEDEDNEEYLRRRRRKPSRRRVVSPYREKSRENKCNSVQSNPIKHNSFTSKNKIPKRSQGIPIKKLKTEKPFSFENFFPRPAQPTFSNPPQPPPVCPPIVTDLVQKYREKRNFIVVKNIPKNFNYVNHLNKYFQRFGDIQVISTFVEDMSALLMFKDNLSAANAMQAPSIPFGLKQIELYCKGEKKKVSLLKPQGQHSQVRFLSKKMNLLAKKRHWKMLQETKRLILARLTSYIHLTLELKRAESSKEAKGCVGEIIKTITNKMKRVKECKDLSILEGEFTKQEMSPLDCAMVCRSNQKLEYELLSERLGKYGKVEQLVIDGDQARVSYFSITSAYRAFHEFEGDPKIDCEFKDQGIREIVASCSGRNGSNNV